jgi:mono/diheme cytochrome c family protein
VKRFCSLVLVLAGFRHCGPIQAQETPELALKARDVLRKHCFECHGQNPKKPKGALNLFDRSHLDDKERGIVVAKTPGESELVKRIEDGTMPAGKRAKVPAPEQKVLRDWILAGAPAFPAEPASVPSKEQTQDQAARVKEIFRVHCFECHGGSKKQAGVAILDHALLLKKRKVIPGKADESLLYQLVTATDNSVMPPPGQPRLNQEECDAVRQWISNGATPFPADVPTPAEAKKEAAFKGVSGVEYVLKKILAHVRAVDLQDRRFMRYFSINHVLAAGTTANELELQREALVKAVNHLSWQERLARPVPIDEPVNSIFAVDLRLLGWHQTPFERWQGNRKLGPSPVNIFDLALLDYPYGIVYEDSETFDNLRNDFLIPSGMVRPIPYVRADWFVSTITQSPFYEDFLSLPFELKELEEKLNVDAEANLRDYIGKRAGFSVSDVSRNNRVVERHPQKYGAYWKSFDFRTSKGQENIFRDPINLYPAAGEMIFNLPNGLQGYFIANNKGMRVEAAPTEIVTDKFAEDKTVRNGLACMRCHDRGMKEFIDTVRPALVRLPGSPGFDKRQALQLYPEQKDMDDWLKEDGDRFVTAMGNALGKPLTREPLIPVSRRFLDLPLHLGTVAGELGLVEAADLTALFRAPQFVGLGLIPLGAQGVVRRDAWEDHFDGVVRNIGLGVPIVPLDGVARRDFPSVGEPFKITLKTNKKANIFEPGDEAVILVTNESSRAIYLELIGTSTRGRKVILTATPVKVAAGQTYRYPPDGGLKIRGAVGKEQITAFSSQQEFAGGELLRGKYVTDRVIHPFYQYQKDGDRWKLNLHAAGLVKKTIDIETK